MFFILFILIGGALGYFAAPKFGVAPTVGGGVGVAGGLVGGIIAKIVLPVLLGLIGAAVGALALLFIYREVRKR